MPKSYQWGGFFCGTPPSKKTPPSCLKIIGGLGGVRVGGLQDYLVIPSPFGFFGAGTGLDWVGSRSLGIGD